MKLVIIWKYIFFFLVTVPTISDLCSPSPCGPNAICKNGNCECLPEYIGNPYEACRPECILNSECPRDKTCLKNKCKDPCPGTCGQNAVCDVVNHIPVCSCIPGYIGDPFVSCRTQPQGKCNKILFIWISRKINNSCNKIIIKLFWNFQSFESSNLHISRILNL